MRERTPPRRQRLTALVACSLSALACAPSASESSPRSLDAGVDARSDDVSADVRGDASDAFDCPPGSAPWPVERPSACVRSSALACGPTATRCGPDAPVCVDGVCVPCPSPQVWCSSTFGCVDTRSSSAHCGGCARACSDGAPCVDGACVPCPEGTGRCGRASCESLASDNDNCGACGQRCPRYGQRVVSSACRAGRCEVTACIAGTADCDGDPDSICETTTLVDNRHCGACGHACEADALCVSGRCASVAVRQRSPVTIERVSSTRPTLRWALSVGTTGARVELCDTYACDTIASAWEVAGDRLRVPTPLSGGIHYWRLHAMRGARTDPTPGPTWAFSVPPHAVVQEGRIDLNGDGFADVVHANQLGTDAELGMPDPEAGISYGTPEGLLPSNGMPDPRLGYHTVYALEGDFDCDGYGDFATYTAVSLGVAGPTSILSGQSLTLVWTLPPLAFEHRDTLDFNGDGCVDYVLPPRVWIWSPFDVLTRGPTAPSDGLWAHPDVLVDSIPARVGDGSDYNGDGYDDYVSTSGDRSGDPARYRYAIYMLGGADGLRDMLRR